MKRKNPLGKKRANAGFYEFSFDEESAQVVLPESLEFPEKRYIQIENPPWAGFVLNEGSVAPLALRLSEVYILPG